MKILYNELMAIRPLKINELPMALPVKKLIGPSFILLEWVLAAVKSFCGRIYRLITVWE